MEINQKKETNAVIVLPSGRVDAITSSDLDKFINNLMEEENICNMILNLSAVNYLSSAGLRVILSGAKKLKEKNGKMIICGLSGNTEEVFKMTGFISIFPVFKTEEEAVKGI